MYLNDREEHFMLNNFNLGVLKLFLLLYADDIVLYSETEHGFQHGLLLLENYYDQWKLVVNIANTEIMVFRKGGQLRRNMKFMYKGNKIEIVKKFTYLGIIFTTGGSFTCTFETLSGHATKAIYKLKKCLLRYPFVTVKHRLDLFDKLILPISNYGSEVWGLLESPQLERVLIRYCKELLCVRQQTQNNFIYGELGRTTLLSFRSYYVIKYWLKIVHMKCTKYVKIVYNLLYNDI